MTLRMVLSCFVVLASSSAPADLLWDNNILSRGRGRAISPPLVPDIRVADDIIVDVPWRVDAARYTVIEIPAEWSHGGVTQVYLWPDAGGRPGTQPLRVLSGQHVRTPTGRSTFGREIMLYTISDLNLELDPGTYWIGFRHPNADGPEDGSAYWLADSDGGRDGNRSRTGWFSVDQGRTWTHEGPDWHHAFEIHGEVVPEPATVVLLGTLLSAQALVRRRRRANP